MIKSVSVSNLGPISQLNSGTLGSINLIIGENQSGKTFLLKAIFSALKAVETIGRGKENRSDKEILSDKLYWTFQNDLLGSVVRKRSESMSFTMSSDKNEELSFTIGSRAAKQVSTVKNTFSPHTSNTVFIPAKEVLTIKDIILEKKEEKLFGFEEPYSDLAKALSRTQKGRNFEAFSQARVNVSDMIGGRLKYDEKKDRWVFKDKGNCIYELPSASEGVKKLAILDLLLGNRYLNNKSVIIIDEIESNLHPSLITKLLNTALELSKCGVQFFVSSHSYFVIKRLYLLAHMNNMRLPVLSFDNGQCAVDDLGKNMPKNPIIDESINLYKDEISL